MNKPARPDPWPALRALTPARIGLGRAGVALPTTELLAFGLAHAKARDAVHCALDPGRLAAELAALGIASRRVKSRALDRRSYLLRPDLGRTLAPDDAAALQAEGDAGREAGAGSPLCLVVADGLSATAAQRHAPPLLAALRQLDGGRFADARVLIAEQARVALGDEIGQCLRARAVVMLIGERPGLSSPDSLGLYLTWDPRVGRTDAERNCLSNIRPDGLPPAEAARRLAWLIDAAAALGSTGVGLKDESEAAGRLAGG